ncbi:Uncharacterised protein [Mycobacteroides abscessus subsp. abscessus]|nr:Uncharacterised protein [Mycobacteroides abscessus subsp. abscessus]
MSLVGWKEDVMATPWVRSRSSLYSNRPAPTMDSEFVRVSTPSRCDSLGSNPLSFILNSRFCVPQVPAANTTYLAV